MATPRIKELIESIISILPSNSEGIKDDFKDNLKILLNDYLKKISNRFTELIGLDFDIKTEVVKEIPYTSRGKYRYIKQKLNIHDYIE